MQLQMQRLEEMAQKIKNQMEQAAEGLEEEEEEEEASVKDDGANNPAWSIFNSLHSLGIPN